MLCFGRGASGATSLGLFALFLRGASGAGWCAGIERGEGCGAAHANSVEAQTLHLAEGEQPRDTVWGAGMIETVLDADVLVAGGGSAGTSAAIAAARSGATVVLVNGRPVLGGNSGSEVRLSMVGACGPRAGSGDKYALRLECREGGIVEEYQLDNAVNNADLVPELFSLELLTLIKAEPRITLLQNTWLVGVTTTRNGTDQAAAQAAAAGGRNEGEAPPGPPATIETAVLEDQASQRRYIVRAKTYIDATGDGRLGAEAGAEWIQGREGFAKYNESLAKLGFYRDADDGPDHETEGTSLDYMAENKQALSTYRAPFWAAQYNASQFEYRGVTGDRPYGYWWNEISWPYNTITDGENVTQEALADILGIWDYLKNSGDHPESATMGLTWVGMVPCKREGRRFVGQYVLSQNDVMAEDFICTRKPPWCPPKPDPPPPPTPAQEPELFWDRVAYAGWPFDLHNPKGMRDPAHPPFTSHKMPYMYSTPLRSLVSKDLTNLFFAGRLASFSHVVYGSQRVMKTCATMGQAAGTAAAYAVSAGLAPIALKEHPDAVWSIQQQLLRDDAYLIGSLNEDPRDHARHAAVSASSEQANATDCGADGAATHVVSGQARAVVTTTEGMSMGSGGGVPASQGINGTNRWISRGLPATISLALAGGGAGVRLKQLQLTFDTGMHRTLSYSVTYKTNNPHSNWGPQPETVRDYVVEGETAPGVWTVLCNITDNYQRRRVHTLPCAAPEPPGPPPPKPKPVVAPGAVSAVFCNATAPGQRWTLAPAGGGGADGAVVVRSAADQQLCLGFDANVSAYGGEGSAVVARPCGSGSGSGSPTAWKWSKEVGGSFLQTATALPHACGGGGGGGGGGSANQTTTTQAAAVPAAACGCAHPVPCTACHGDNIWYPPTSVELAACSAGSHMKWTRLIVDDGGGGGEERGDGGDGDGSGMLMTDGLCLQAPTNQTGVHETAPAPAPPQRVRRKSPRDLEAEAAPAPALSAVRVTVTATNGIADARINEIRLYDAEGVAPFPEKPSAAAA